MVAAERQPTWIPCQEEKCPKLQAPLFPSGSCAHFGETLPDKRQLKSLSLAGASANSQSPSIQPVGSAAAPGLDQRTLKRLINYSFEKDRLNAFQSPTLLSQQPPIGWASHATRRMSLEGIDQEQSRRFTFASCARVPSVNVCYL